jgi:TctA family transporter
MFGIAEIILNLERPEARSVLKTTVGSLWLTKEEFRRATPSVLRGTVLGSALGILPGGGASLAAFGAYMLERKMSKGRTCSARAPSRAWPGRKRPTTPPRRPPSSRC